MLKNSSTVWKQTTELEMGELSVQVSTNKDRYRANKYAKAGSMHV